VQVADLIAVRGDPSDKLPGRHGDLEAALEGRPIGATCPFSVMRQRIRTDRGQGAAQAQASKSVKNAHDPLDN